MAAFFKSKISKVLVVLNSVKEGFENIETGISEMKGTILTHNNKITFLKESLRDMESDFSIFSLDEVEEKNYYISGIVENNEFLAERQYHDLCKILEISFAT